MSLCAAPLSRAGEVWKVEATASDELETAVDNDGAITTETVEREFKLSFDNDISKEISLKIEFDYTDDDEIVESDFDTSTTEASVGVDLKGPWWTVSGEFTETVEKTDDPGEATTIDDSYSVEVKLEPEHDLLPDLTFTLEGDDDGLDRSYEGAFEYALLELFEFKIEADKETSASREPGEDDTDDRTLSTEVSFDQDFGDAWKVELAWTNDREQSLTLDHADTLLEKEDTLDNELKGKIDFKTVDWFGATLERSYEWNKEFGTGEPTEVTDNWKGEITAEPELTDFINLKLSFSDEREETDGTDSDEQTWTQEFSAELEYKPFDILTVKGTYDGSLDRAWPEDPADESTRDRSDEYEIAVEAKVWEDQISAKLTRSFTYEWESGSRSSRERNWEFESEWKLETIPGLKFTPTISQTTDEDFLEATDDTEIDIEVDITYEVTLGDVTTLKAEHTYSRASFYPPDEVHYLEREDDTTLTLELSDFFRGMTMKTEWSRQASDKSEDDEGPEVDYNVAWEFEWKALESYELSLKYEYDMPDESEDSRAYEVTFKFPFFLDHFEVNFEYTHETQIEGDTDTTYTYLIEVKGEF